MKQHQDDFKAPICNVQLSFVPSKQMHEFLSSSYTMCSVKVDKSKYEVTFPEILYPVSSTQQSCTGPANKVVAAAGKIESERQRQGVALTQLKGRERSRAGPANKVVPAAGKRESERQRQGVALTQLKGRERSRAGPANKVVAAAGKRESARQRVALTQLKGRERSRAGPANKVVAAAGKIESERQRQGVALTQLKGRERSRAGPANKVVAAAGKRESARQRVALTQLKGRERSRAGPANKVVAAAGKRESARQRVALTQLKGRKLTSYNVKLSDDRYECNITGMAAITNDGRRLLVDYDNNKVKLFSPDMKLLSSLSLSDPPRDIAVLSDQEAVVTTVNRSLVLLDISSRHMSINDTTRVSYDVCGISKCG